MSLTNPSEDEVLRVAMAIEGPKNELPLSTKFTLKELRLIRWNRLSSQDKGEKLWEARSAIREMSKMVEHD